MEVQRWKLSLYNIVLVLVLYHLSALCLLATESVTKKLLAWVALKPGDNIVWAIDMSEKCGWDDRILIETGFQA